MRVYGGGKRVRTGKKERESAHARRTRSYRAGARKTPRRSGGRGAYIGGFRISESAATEGAQQRNSPRATQAHTPHKEQDGEIGGRVSLTLVSDGVECRSIEWAECLERQEPDSLCHRDRGVYFNVPCGRRGTEWISKLHKSLLCSAAEGGLVGGELKTWGGP